MKKAAARSAAFKGEAAMQDLNVQMQGLSALQKCLRVRPQPGSCCQACTSHPKAAQDTAARSDSHVCYNPWWLACTAEVLKCHASTLSALLVDERVHTLMQEGGHRGGFQARLHQHCLRVECQGAPLQPAESSQVCSVRL